MNTAFVVPFMFKTSTRFLRAALKLPGVRIGLISQDPPERFGSEVADALAGHCQVQDALSSDQLVAAVNHLSGRMGKIERLLGVLEQLQVPLSEAQHRLGLPGLSVEAAHLFRDKSLMKDRLRQAGLPCARHQLAVDAHQIRSFIDQVGFPIIMKPTAGAGAVNTFRLDRIEQLEEALRAFPPNAERPMLMEEFIVGEECSFDAVSVSGRTVWHSISEYSPSPLEVMRNDWIQWCVLLPRTIGGPEYESIRTVAAQALSTLGLKTGLAHMEWFRRADGSVAISEVGARPPGAQFTSLLSYAHDTDMYEAWARLMITGEFTPPERRYAAGAAYLRGQGRGRVRAIHGLDRAQREMGDLVMEISLPQAGQHKSSSYEGDGHVILRHGRTEVVAAALKRLISLIEVELA